MVTRALLILSLVVPPAHGSLSLPRAVSGGPSTALYHHQALQPVLKWMRGLLPAPPARAKMIREVSVARPSVPSPSFIETNLHGLINVPRAVLDLLGISGRLPATERSQALRHVLISQMFTLQARIREGLHELPDNAFLEAIEFAKRVAPGSLPNDPSAVLARLVLNTSTDSELRARYRRLKSDSLFGPLSRRGFLATSPAAVYGKLPKIVFSDRWFRVTTELAHDFLRSGSPPAPDDLNFSDFRLSLVGREILGRFGLHHGHRLQTGGGVFEERPGSFDVSDSIDAYNYRMETWEVPPSEFQIARQAAEALVELSGEKPSIGFSERSVRRYGPEIGMRLNDYMRFYGQFYQIPMKFERFMGMPPPRSFGPEQYVKVARFDSARSAVRHVVEGKRSSPDALPAFDSSRPGRFITGGNDRPAMPNVETLFEDALGVVDHAKSLVRALGEPEPAEMLSETAATLEAPPSPTDDTDSTLPTLQTIEAPVKAQGETHLPQKLDLLLLIAAPTLLLHALLVGAPAPSRALHAAA